MPQERKTFEDWFRAAREKIEHPEVQEAEDKKAKATNEAIGRLRRALEEGRQY